MLTQVIYVNCIFWHVSPVTISMYILFFCVNYLTWYLCPSTACPAPGGDGPVWRHKGRGNAAGLTGSPLWTKTGEPPVHFYSIWLGHKLLKPHILWSHQIMLCWSDCSDNREIRSFYIVYIAADRVKGATDSIECEMSHNYMEMPID